MTWHIYLVLTVLTWGGYNILFKFATNKIDFALLLLIAGTVNALTAVPWVIIAYMKMKSIHCSIEGVGISVFMGMLMTLGGVTFFSAFKLGAPVSVATPVFSEGMLLLSAVVGIFFLGEAMTPRWIMGMLFGATSILLLTIK